MQSREETTAHCRKAVLQQAVQTQGDVILSTQGCQHNADTTRASFADVVMLSGR